MSAARPNRVGTRTLSFVVAVTIALVGMISGQAWQAPSATAAPTSSGVESPLSLTATANPASVSRVGQEVSYAFVARNAGDEILRELVVRAPFAGLSALVCSPVPLGGDLPPGAATTCGATRTTTVRDLARSSLNDVAGATARGTTVASATTRVEVAVAAPAPVATDDSVEVVAGGSTAVLEGSHNDRPGVPGGPAIDPTRTVLTDADARHGGKELDSRWGTWRVRPNGRILLSPARGLDAGASGTVGYRVVDEAGRSATGKLEVTVLRPAAAVTDEASTRQATPVTVAVLRNDEPGQGSRGTRAAFDAASVRFRQPQFGGPFAGAVVAPDRRKVTVPSVGSWLYSDTGRVTFRPLPAFRGSASTGYTARSSNSSTTTGVLRVTVTRVTPRVGNQRLETTYGRAVTFPGARDALPGAPSAPLVPAATILVAPGVAPGGKTYESRAGTWSVRADGSVHFVPADGYSGTSAVSYGAGDRNGVRGFARLIATVRKGPRSVLVQKSTPAGAEVRLQPLTQDEPGQRADGSTADFDPTSLVLLPQELPAGSVVSDDGRTAMVPGQGVWRVDNGSGSVSFRPEPLFAGAATATYQVRNDAGLTLTGRVAVAVTGSGPVATDDLSSTPATARVGLPGATNDSPGAAALRPELTIFPEDGQPTGSSRAPDGKTLSVPNEGSWVLGADGSATFSPVPTFTGRTAAVTYQVSDAAGSTTRASMNVLVQAGPTGRPDAVRLGLRRNDAVIVRPLDNDVPGRNADGRIGSTDATSLRLATTGQAAGWTVHPDGLSADHRSGVRIEVRPSSGEIEVRRLDAPAETTLPLVYSVRDTALPVSGARVHRTYTSSLSITVPVAPNRATDDHGYTTQPVEALLPAAANDLPGDPSHPISKRGEDVSFPTAQLATLPRGSTIGIEWGTALVLMVPGEGRWVRLLDGGGTVEFYAFRDFTGEATPVTYEVRDPNRPTIQGTLRVTVRPGGKAQDDTGRTSQGVRTTIDVFANDDGGLNADGTPALIEGEYFVETGLPPGSTVSTDLDEVTVPGEGRYTIQPVTGRVVFRPDRGFTGRGTRLTLDFPWRAVLPNGSVTSWLRSTLQVTVDPVVPVAHGDTAKAGAGEPVVVPVLTNDEPGVVGVPLVASSLRLQLAPGLPQGSTLDGDAKALVVPGRGVFLVSGAGEITFVPLGGETRPPLTVGYEVADANGTRTRSTLTIATSP